MYPLLWFIIDQNKLFKPYPAYHTGKKYAKYHNGYSARNGISALLDADGRKIDRYHVKHRVRASHYHRGAKGYEAVRAVFLKKGRVCGV